MSPIESALTFACHDEQLVGVLASPSTASTEIGVLILVGGPQYRAGSHRQFTLLARQLANRGYPTLRFDYRGMGDSSGSIRSFEEVDDDIAAALAAFQAGNPVVRQFVLWGLCDAASAALLYWQRTKDARIAGLCLLNPWVRSTETLARAQVKHYYLQRLLQRAFWLKLSRGGVAIMPSVREFLQKLTQLFASGHGVAGPVSFQQRMRMGWDSFKGEILLTLSGQDLTAKEFLEHANSALDWQGLLTRPNITRRDIPAADHTFSSALWRAEVENITADWLDEKFPSARHSTANPAVAIDEITNPLPAVQPTATDFAPYSGKVISDAK
ncbi:hydrolase 1, exosortase A system-associated [Chitinimonas sp. BJB300]|uniref:hydrolase 1, exosortase A system-associated n=1 Tax=Chitinimonas sp. BJB300 TaxID=1559339 RepID=UPI000C104270|nr:hydrolase 1, exosortase A system-associated [Chitinimonas sp. BJB300]PHV13355.1 hydrolase 1, exosortase A system-associated [Chitinimonas sp. BJB300]TSJ85270.1 hydrolase 1, exosortase A system-associated [Chitinimonas sp. BJB300]